MEGLRRIWARRVVALVGTLLCSGPSASAGAAESGGDAANARAGVSTGDVGGASAGPPSESLRVAVAGSPPFVVGADNTDGLAIDVWTAVAGELGVAFELVAAGSVDGAIDEVVAGRADVAVGPISITAKRAERVAFTQPYFQAHLSIAAPPERDWLARVKPFLTLAFLSGLGGLVLILFIVGTLVWLAERKKNPEEFPERAVAGIFNGIWMALVTMTTVGYGDRVPRTGVGRFVTGIWMLLSMLIAGSLIAFMSTALTVSQLGDGGITSASGLHGRRVAAVAGTTSERFVVGAGGRTVSRASLGEALAAVELGSADAAVFDRPALQYYLREHPETELVVADARYQPTGYGFAVRQESPLLQRLNIAVLRLQGRERLTPLTRRWLGAD